MQWLIKVGPIGFCIALAGCALSHDVGVGAEELNVAAPGPALALSAACRAEVDDSIDGLPKHLSCTGLYSNLSRKQVASSNENYEPGVTLWSDGAQKSRWLYLPPGKTIDASNPNSWVFPIGTKAWKEFRLQDGTKRVETRIFQKAEADRWIRGTYVWDEAESEAVRSLAGQDMMVGDKPYHLPSGTECDDCHAGRKDRLLGIEQAALGLATAKGVTLARLLSTKRISGLEGGTHYEIGDDGTGVAAPALGWMHMNCGVSCHNDNPNSKGYPRGMRLALDPEQLDGRDPSEFQSVTTTVGVDATTLRWLGKKRIVAGSPEDSLSYVLLSQRGDKQQQMPPIASMLVDEDNMAIVAEWISKLPRTP